MPEDMIVHKLLLFWIQKQNGLFDLFIDDRVLSVGAVTDIQQTLSAVNKGFWNLHKQEVLWKRAAKIL